MTDAPQAVMGARREPMNARLSGPSRGRPLARGPFRVAHPDSAARRSVRPDRTGHAPPRVADDHRAGRAGARRGGGDLLRELPRHRGPGRCGARLSGADARADDVERRHRRRGRLGGGPSAGRRSRRGCPGVGLACHAAGLWTGAPVYRRRDRGRAGAVSGDGRHGRDARRGAHLFESCVRRLRAALDRRIAVLGSTRRRRRADARDHHLGRRYHSGRVVAGLDLRLGPLPRLGSPAPEHRW